MEEIMINEYDVSTIEENEIQPRLGVGGGCGLICAGGGCGGVSGGAGCGGACTAGAVCGVVCL